MNCLTIENASLTTTSVNNHFYSIYICGCYFSACNQGYFGLNCETKCPFPYYGFKCRLVCNCIDTDCHHVSGCGTASGGTSSTILDNFFKSLTLWCMLCNCMLYYSMTIEKILICYEILCYGSLYEISMLWYEI